MATQLQKVNRRRRISYLSSIVSIAMVLLMLGLFGLIYIQSNRLNSIIKENVFMSVYLTDNIDQIGIDKNMQVIRSMPDVNEVKFISKDEAAADLSKEMGQDIVGFAGYNPLPPAIEISLKAASVDNARVQALKATLLLLPGVSEVKYNEILFGNVESSLGSVSYVLIGLAVLFVIIALFLINSTIRLNLYARRFSIKSMQLVGATHWFIIKPFVIRSFFNGLYGGILSLALLCAILWALPNYLPSVQLLYDTESFAILFIGLILVGILVSMVSSWISTNKYLKAKIEDLY